MLWEQLETIPPYTKRLTSLLNGLRILFYDVFRAGWVSFSTTTGQFQYTKEFGYHLICTITVFIMICKSLRELPILQFAVCIVCFIGETPFHSQFISYPRKEQTEWSSCETVAVHQNELQIDEEELINPIGVKNGWTIWIRSIPTPYPRRSIHILHYSKGSITWPWECGIPLARKGETGKRRRIEPISAPLDPSQKR